MARLEFHEPHLTNLEWIIGETIGCSFVSALVRIIDTPVGCNIVVRLVQHENRLSIVFGNPVGTNKNRVAWFEVRIPHQIVV